MLRRWSRGCEDDPKRISQGASADLKVFLGDLKMLKGCNRPHADLKGIATAALGDFQAVIGQEVPQMKGAFFSFEQQPLVEIAGGSIA